MKTLTELVQEHAIAAVALHGEARATEDALNDALAKAEVENVRRVAAEDALEAVDKRNAAFAAENFRLREQVALLTPPPDKRLVVSDITGHTNGIRLRVTELGRILRNATLDDADSVEITAESYGVYAIEHQDGLPFLRGYVVTRDER